MPSRSNVVVAFVAAWAAAVSVRAAPPTPPARPAPPPPEPILQLLHDRDLLPAEATTGALERQVQQVREAASDLVLAAMNFLGVPYRRGGASAAQGFDCSGFTRYVFEHSVGLLLPHRADEQARLAGLLQVRRDELKPGDLVFFDTMRRAFSHVGIYIGDGRFIHAPATGGGVRVEDMRQAYWARRFDGARRVGPRLGAMAGIAPATAAAASAPGAAE